MSADTASRSGRRRSRGALADIKRLETYASWMACLGDVSRLQILSELATGEGPVQVGALVRSTGLAQATVSYHLKVLADAGFVGLMPSGTSTLVSINSDCMMGLPAVISAILGDDGAAELACTTCNAPITAAHPDRVHT